MSFFINPNDVVKDAIEGIDGVIFHFRIFTSAEMSSIAIEQNTEGVSGTEGVTEEGISHLGRVIRMGLRGWEGEGAPEFKVAEDGYMDEGMLDFIPFGRWMAIYLAILAINVPTEEDEGNSQ